MRIPILVGAFGLAITAALLLASCDSLTPQYAETSDITAESRAPGSGFTYQTVMVPDSRLTTVFGINPRGDMVGFYVDQTFVARGFLLKDGEFTTLDFPGAAGTNARGIGPDGTVVGNYWNPGDPAAADHSFRWTAGGGFEHISVPGYLHSIAQRILPDGTIVGCVHDMDRMASMKGVVIGKHHIQVDDIFASMHNGATPSGRVITGLYTNEALGQTRGYLLRNGHQEDLLVPGSDLTAAWDMNPAGEVVGAYRVPGTPAVFRGFILRGKNYVTVHFPGAVHTRAFGINPGGRVVGHYIEGGVTRGFVATPTRRP
jgi:uncharacterized membrane protein